MKKCLKRTFLFGMCIITAQLMLTACGDDGDDATGDGGDNQGGGDTDSGSGDNGGGDSDSTSQDSDNVGIPFVASCGEQSYTGTGFDYAVCQEYFFEADETLEQESQTTCSTIGGTWSDARCPTAGSNGTCTTVGDATIVQFYYQLPEAEIATYQNTCEGLGNTWTAP